MRDNDWKRKRRTSICKRTGNRNKLEKCQIVVLIFLLLVLIYVIISILISGDHKQNPMSRDERRDEIYKDNVIFDSLGIRHIPDFTYPSHGCKPLPRTNTFHRTKLHTKRTCLEDYELIILVTSHMHNFDRRMSIRNTWGVGASKFNYKTFFVVGTSDSLEKREMLSCENEHNNDIIFGPVNEDISNLTYKLQMGFEWANRYCNFTYLLKTDDDVFVNIQLLFNFLRSEDTPKNKLYAGNVHYRSVVIRTGIYNITKQEYWKDVYPRYCSGGGFVVSRDVLTKMVSHFKDTMFVKTVDAYVGELALMSNVDVLHEVRFEMNRPKCIYHGKLITHHPVGSHRCMTYLFMKQQFGVITT